jgi:LacI family transcriptional regulator
LTDFKNHSVLLVRREANDCLSCFLLKSQLGKRLPIVIGALKMARYTTLKDVAERAGTTASTVSYVLSSKSGRYISQATREKVMKAVDELDYIKSNSAASLKGKEVKLIGILVPQFENQFFTRIIVSAEKVFMKRGYDLVICDTLDNPGREKDFLRRMLEQRVDGLIVTPTVEGTENTALIRKLGIPMVVVDRPLPGVDDYCRIATDNYGFGKLAAGELQRLGHKNVAYIGWNTKVSDLLLRADGVRDAYEGRGNVVVEETDFSDEGGREGTLHVLKNHPEVTAFIYGFNMQAKGGIRCLTDAGKVIGKDASVIVIGSPEWVNAGSNDFTHVDMGDSEVGSKAAEMLLSLISGCDGPGFEKQILQKCSLVKGTSVADLK